MTFWLSMPFKRHENLNSPPLLQFIQIFNAATAKKMDEINRSDHCIEMICRQDGDKMIKALKTSLGQLLILSWC